MSEPTAHRSAAVTTPAEGLSIDDLLEERPLTGAGLSAGDYDHPDDIEETPTTDVPVDLPQTKQTIGAKVAAAADGERRPVIPPWLSSRQDARAASAWAARNARHIAAFHAVRAPVYAGKVAAFAPIGVAKGVAKVHRFVTDSEAHHLRVQAVHRDDPKAYLLLVKERNARLARRAQGVGVAVLLILVAAVVAYFTLPGWALTATVAVCLLALARYGAPADTPLVGHAVAKAEAPRLTSTSIIIALGGLGIAALTQKVTKGRTADMFPTPITRVRTGFVAAVDLPHGVTAEEVAERRDKLASGLRRPIGAVWPEADHDTHSGRLVLYVLDQPMSKLAQPAWPLAKGGAADVFKPLPYGYDQKGDLVTIPLMFSNLLVGAIPRQGKSFAVRVVVLAAALDPTVEMHCHELKGTGDFEAVEPSCHRYVSGPGDDASLSAVMASIREVHGYLDPRARTIAKLGPARCPEKKVTRQLADDRSLKLWPVVLVIDEVQELFDSEYASEAEQLLKAIIKRGPALGIMLILSTQRPDAKSLPTSISSNMGARLCLRVTGQTENDMILGTSAYKAGMRATLFTDSDLGIGLLRTGGVSATTVRSSYLDGPSAQRIGRRAHALRTAAGTLTGQAIGQVPESDVDRLSVVVDTVAAWAAADGDDSAWLHCLEEVLAEQQPGRYGDLEAPWLGARLRAVGVATQDQRKRRIEGEQVNRAGVEMEALRKALASPTG